MTTPNPLGATVPPMIFRLAVGEASGDLLASLLLKGMRQQWPQLDAAGIGGGKMEAHGFQCWHRYDRLAVHGYIDALKNYRELRGLQKSVAHRVIIERPNAFIGVDAPDFNLGLEKQVKAVGIKTIHFVSPSVWAWRGWRINSIAKSTDLMLCLFPFEPEIYKKVNVAAEFVGHPFADEIPLEIDQEGSRAALGIHNPKDAVIALMPGSRKSEVSQLTPTFLQTAKQLLQKRPHLTFLLPVAPNMMPIIKPLLVASKLHEYIRLLDGQANLALAACDVTLIASGTATLEAALYKKPMVIAYKVGNLSALLYRKMAYLPWIGLPNILCNSSVIPERVQDEMNANQLETDLLKWLDSPKSVTTIQQRFTELHLQLKRDTAKTATHAIANFLDEKPTKSI